MIDALAGDPPTWSRILDRGQLARIFSVLEVTGAADTAVQVRDAVPGAIARQFGIPRVTMFIGRNYTNMFADPDPLITGIPAGQLREYQARWFEKDIFRLPRAQRLLDARGFTRLGELSGLPSPQRAYVGDYLHRYGIGAAAAIGLRFADGEAILGMFQEVDPWSESDLVALRMLAGQLRALTRNLPVGRDTRADPELRAVLTARQLDVARLVARGMRNAQIAAELGVTELTVKKYLSRMFAATGLPNRAALTAAVLRTG